MKSTPRTLHRVLIAASLVTMLSSCQMDSDQPEPDRASDQPTTSASASASAPASSATPEPSASLPPNVPKDLGAPLKTLTYDDKRGTKATLEVFPLRQGDGGSVQLWARPVKDPSASEGRIHNLLTYAWNATDGGSSVPDGFVLVDSAHRTMYQPMKQPDGSVACAPGLLKMGFEAKEAYVSCLLTRPQSDRVSIDIVNFGRVHDAPIR